MNRVVLEDIVVCKGKVEYIFSVSGEIKKYFIEELPYFLEYKVNGNILDMENVPKAVLAIPFVTNVLPIIWMTKSELLLSQLDADFYDSISEFKKGYEDMFPNISFEGNVIVKELKKAKTKELERSATFFSAGLDSWCTLLEHLEEKPDLFLIWGSDIPYTNEKGWNVLLHQIEVSAEEFNLNLVTVQSSFRKIVHELNLNLDYMQVLNDDWWHCMQHGIGIIGHSAPANYLRGVTKQYIAASFTKNDKVTCASRPEIDNYVRFFDCQVYHDSFISRTEKTEKIVSFAKKYDKKVHMHVCWQTTNGMNCCRCEKCYRTIMGILVNGENPEEYGFDSKEYTFEKMKKYICEEFNFEQTLFAKNYWIDLKAVAKRNANTLKKKSYYEKIKWIEEFDFEKR